VSGAQLHACPTCGRRFVVVPGRSVADPPRCTCGAALSRSELAGGVYELRKSRRASRRRGTRSSGPADTMPHEPDLGYGESHGYGPAHGGPTGPGDAPAAPLPRDAPPDGVPQSRGAPETS
jgi:hypothetical protein